MIVGPFGPVPADGRVWVAGRPDVPHIYIVGFLLLLLFHFYLHFCFASNYFIPYPKLLLFSPKGINLLEYAWYLDVCEHTKISIASFHSPKQTLDILDRQFLAALSSWTSTNTTKKTREVSTKNETRKAQSAGKLFRHVSFHHPRFSSISHCLDMKKSHITRFKALSRRACSFAHAKKISLETFVTNPPTNSIKSRV